MSRNVFHVENGQNEIVFSGTQSECENYAMWVFPKQHTHTLRVLNSFGESVFVNHNGHTFVPENA